MYNEDIREHLQDFNLSVKTTRLQGNGKNLIKKVRLKTSQYRNRFFKIIIS